MASSSSSSEPVRPARAAVPAPSSSTLDGEPYVRRGDVEAEIAAALHLRRTEWLGLRAGKTRAHSETLVFLARQAAKDDRDLCGQLVHEISRRAVHAAQRWARGRDESKTEEIALQVAFEIVELVLAEETSRQSEFLEIAFDAAIKRRTLNALEKCKEREIAASAPVVRWDSDSESATEVDVMDDRPGPEDILIQSEAAGLQTKLARKAISAVTDPRHREAFILRHIRGWPITSRDSSTPSLELHFGKSGRQIQNWINSALRQMREAIGDTE